MTRIDLTDLASKAIILAGLAYATWLTVTLPAVGA